MTTQKPSTQNSLLPDQILLPGGPLWYRLPASNGHRLRWRSCQRSGLWNAWGPSGSEATPVPGEGFGEMIARQDAPPYTFSDRKVIDSYLDVQLSNVNSQTVGSLFLSKLFGCDGLTLVLHIINQHMFHARSPAESREARSLLCGCWKWLPTAKVWYSL